MTETAPPPEDTRLIDEGGHLSQWLIAQVIAFLAPEPGKELALPFLRWLMRHYIVPAEAVLRRTIHLIAAALPPLVAAPVRASTAPRRAVPPAPSAPSRTPRFRLTEPPPRPTTDRLPLHLRPRISIAGLSPPPAPRPANRASAADYEARLRRRLDALTAAWKAPDAEARRLQRLRARGQLKSPALSFLKVPGGAAKGVNDIAARVLGELNQAVFNAAASANTS